MGLFFRLFVISVVTALLIKRFVIDSKLLIELHPHNELGSCIKVYGAVGVEDIVVTKDGIALLSSLDKRKLLKHKDEGSIAESGIFAADLNQENVIPEKLEIIGIKGTSMLLIYHSNCVKRPISPTWHWLVGRRQQGLLVCCQPQNITI